MNIKEALLREIINKKIDKRITIFIYSSLLGENSFCKEDQTPKSAIS